VAPRFDKSQTLNPMNKGFANSRYVGTVKEKLNYAGRGCDIETYQVQELHVIVDTFTVMNPDSYFALSQPENNFTFDILNVKIVPTNQDLYVSPNGDNTNSGLTQSDPLKIIAYALTKIASDSTHPNTIHLANGMYSPSITGEIFPLNCRSYVSIIGESQENTILDGNNLSGLIACIFGDNYFYIENLTIQNGHASVGGGLHFSTNSNPIVKNVTLQNNSASGGGAIMCSNNSNPIFEYVTIEDNYAESIGGGIYLSNSSPLLKNVIISNNSVQPVWGSSAGINLSNNSNPTLVDVLIANNTSDGLGSIIGNGINSCPILNNITVANNNIPTNVIYCTFNNNLNFNNCILFNTESNYEINFDESGYSNEVTISYTDIKNGDDGIQTNGAGTVNWLEGNIDSIPQFVGGDPFSYELSAGSPCIDSGTPDTTGLNLPPYDLAGNPRIYNGRIDIGAYEYQDVGIDQPDTSFIHNLYLFNNSPNPFRGSTTISFISADYERIKDYTLSIYNTKGQLVKRYYGSKDDFWVRTEIVWDGTDEQGKQVAPGAYFYKLEYNGNAVVRKMVMLR